MEIKQSRDGDIIVVELRGSVDSRSAHELERELTEPLDKGARLFAIGFQELEQLTGSGLRVLVMLAKKLVALDGGLVLYSLSPQVKTIFEVSGLSDLFAIEPTKSEALRYLSSSKRMSKLSFLAMKLLDGGEEGGSRGKRAEPDGRSGTGSRLSAQVARLLSPDSDSLGQSVGGKTDDDEEPESGV